MKIDRHVQSFHAIVGPTKVLNGVAAVTSARVEYSAAADPDWVVPGRCRPANQRAATLGRAGILAELRNLRIRSQTMKPTAPFRDVFSVIATTPWRGLSLSR